MANADSNNTSYNEFFSCGEEGVSIFAVRAGVSSSDALEQASCFLATALAATYDVAELNGAAYSPAYIIEMAKAIIDSVRRTLDGPVSPTIEKIAEYVRSDGRITQ
jgi:hypothetical protein